MQSKTSTSPSRPSRPAEAPPRAKDGGGAPSIPPAAVAEIAASLRGVLADALSLFITTKGAHWHVDGPHFRDHHRLLDEHAQEVLAMVDPLAERARKLGASTLRTVHDVVHLRGGADAQDRPSSNEAWLRAVLVANRDFERALRRLHATCAGHGDVATTSLVEAWIDETEGRCWFLGAALGEWPSAE